MSRIALRPVVARLVFAASAAALTAGATAAPLELSDAVRLALAKSYSVKAEALSPEIARAGLTAAYGEFDPRLQISYSYAEDASSLTADPYNPARPATSLIVRDSYDAGITGLLPLGTTYWVGVNGVNRRGTFNAFTDQFFTFSGVEVTQPLLRNFGLSANLASIRIARTDQKRSEWEYRQAIIDTVTEVIFAYQELHFALESLRIAKRSYGLTSGLVEENEKRFRVGSMSENDVISARARMAQSEETILFAERGVENWKNFLRQLVSDDRTATLLEIPIDIAVPAPIGREAVSPAQDFKTALEHRPDYQQATLLVKRGRYNRDLMFNRALPEVNLVGSYGYHGFGSNWSDSRGELKDRDRRSYSAGAVVRVPLTFTTERGRLRAAKLELKQSELRLEQLEQGILVAVANAAGNIETARKRVASTSGARTLAQQTLDAEIKKLRAGSSSTFQVVQYQRELAMAEVAEIRARVDEQKALAEYDRQIGTTLRTWRIELESKAEPHPRS